MISITSTGNKAFAGLSELLNLVSRSKVKCSDTFKPEQKREHRRKDIPDSWILEAAIDLIAKEKEVIVIGNDGNFNYYIFDKKQEVADQLNIILKEIFKFDMFDLILLMSNYLVFCTMT